MMNLERLFKAIYSKYKVTKEQILSKSRASEIMYCRTLLIGYLVEKYNIDFYTIANYFNRDRTNIYNVIKRYRELEPDTSMFDDIEIYYNPISQEKKMIYFLIERHNIRGNLKQYLLNYEKR